MLAGAQGIMGIVGRKRRRAGAKAGLITNVIRTSRRVLEQNMSASAVCAHYVNPRNRSVATKSNGRAAWSVPHPSDLGQLVGSPVNMPAKT